MELVETTTMEEQSSIEEQKVGGVATLPPPDGKDETPEQEYSPEREAVAGVREALKQRPATFRKEVLSAMLSDVEKTTDKVEELQAMEGKVRAIIDNLDPKTKAVVTVLLKLAAVDGYGVDIDYGYRLLFETLNDPDLVEAAIKKLPNDVDLSYLAEACRVAQFIMDAESSDEDEPESEHEDAKPQTIQRGLTDAELTDMVRGVGTIWPEVDEELESHINHSILASLRNLDYIARQKLILILHGLHDEQRDDRPESKGYRGSLHGFGALADDIEKTIADEAFTQRVSDAVFGLSEDEQRKLVEKLEAGQLAEQNA